MLLKWPGMSLLTPLMMAEQGFLFFSHLFDLFKDIPIAIQAGIKEVELFDYGFSFLAFLEFHMIPISSSFHNHVELTV